jgi:hypothetical protein
MYCGKSRDLTFVLEAIASHGLWIWHFFGLPGSLNDINFFCIDPVYLPNLQVEKILLATTK